jgi:hypothetical protein
MRKETQRLTDVPRAESRATSSPASVPTYPQRESPCLDSDTYHSGTPESLIEPIHTKKHYSLYGSDMAFPGDVLPEFSFDSV